MEKTVETILKRGSDFVIALTANQSTLLQALLWMRLEHTPKQTWTSHKVSRNHTLTRDVRVYACAGKFEPACVGSRSAVCIEQVGIRGDEPDHQRRWFISSLCARAARFAQLIRDHWRIENSLHWVKDVVLHKDRSPLRHPNAAVNTSICRNACDQYSPAFTRCTINQPCHEWGTLRIVCFGDKD